MGQSLLVYALPPTSRLPPSHPLTHPAPAVILATTESTDSCNVKAFLQRNDWGVRCFAASAAYAFRRDGGECVVRRCRWPRPPRLNTCVFAVHGAGSRWEGCAGAPERRARQVARTRRLAARVPDRHGGVLGRPPLGTPVRRSWPHGTPDGAPSGCPTPSRARPAEPAAVNSVASKGTQLRNLRGVLS